MDHVGTYAGTQGPALPEGDEWMLVLAPRTATSLQVGKDGTVTGTVPLHDGVGAATVPVGQTVQLRALNASGAVVGRGTGPIGEQVPAETGQPAAIVDNWS